MKTKHFNHQCDKKIKCSCGYCKSVDLDTRVYIMLELVRAKFDKPVLIHSGYRCKDYNARVGGTRNSQHVNALAADISIKGIEPKLIYKFLSETFPNNFGFGLYKDFVHMDARHKKARWKE